MEYIMMCLDSTNKVEHWYVRHNNVYCFKSWATCFDLYTGHLQALLYRCVHSQLLPYLTNINALCTLK